MHIAIRVHNAGADSALTGTRSTEHKNDVGFGGHRVERSSCEFGRCGLGDIQVTWTMLETGFQAGGDEFHLQFMDTLQVNQNID